MLDALETFTGDGGRLMYLGGNGFYWRVAFNDAFPGVLEVRRGKEGTRLWSGAVGEDHQSFNGEAGGTWRSLGRPPNALFGVGYVGQGFDCASPYRRTPESRDPRVSFMFDGVGAEVFGSAGIVPGGAAGLEIDAANPALATPGHTLVVARSFGHSNAYVPSVDEIEVNYASADATTNPSVRAEISFHETANGGAVFSTGSIAYLGALGLGDGNDPLDRVTLNVVRRFLDPAPFPDIPHRRRAGSGDLGPV
jgi:N,N-dimethylformamidase